MNIKETTPLDRTFNLIGLTGNQLLMLRNVLANAEPHDYTDHGRAILADLRQQFNSFTSENELQWVTNANG